MESHTKKITILALYSAIALTIFMVEAMLPPIAPIPGIKLGLANIITLIVISKYTSKDAFMVLVVRIIMSAIFSGQAVYLIYSVAGGLLCLLVMSLSTKLLNGNFIYITSILGAISHNTGQILAAFFVLGLSGIFMYMPYLIVSGVITGLFTGLVAHFAMRKLP